MEEGSPAAPPATSASRARSAAVLRRSAGALSTAATSRMLDDVAWFRELSAQDRAWVGQILQAGIKGFLRWYDPDEASDGGTTDPASILASSMFGVAPRTLTGAISLQQTVELVRLSIEVVESNLDDLLDPADAPDVHAALLRFSREVAFAAAEVYASAAESRGAWDARLEALVVDAVLRAEADDAVLSRASALGWAAQERVAVVIGSAPAEQPVAERADAERADAERAGSASDRRLSASDRRLSASGSERRPANLFDAVRRAARSAELDALCAVQGDRLVVLLGGEDDPRDGAASLLDLFGEGPVVIGPVAVGLDQGHHSARAALSAHRAAPGWPQAPRPVHSEELLPERALSGDGHARRFLVEEVYLPLAQAGTLLDTVAAYLESGASIEATARALYVHANTVRYRLRQAAELTGLSPTTPREALALQVALILGRQSGRAVVE